MSVDVEENCAIFLFINNVVLEDLVVQGSGSLHNARHLASNVMIDWYRDGDGNGNKSSGKLRVGEGRVQGCCL